MAALLVPLAADDPGEGLSQALFALAIAGAAFWFAGERFLARDYHGIGWLCRAVVALHGINALGRAIAYGRRQR